MTFIKKTMEELERVDAQENKQMQHFPITIVLDNIRSMNNVGSVFRTADAMNIEQILLCGLTPTPPHREIQKTALGATESVQWTQYASVEAALQQLKKEGYKIVGIEQVHDSQPLGQTSIDPSQKIALIFGNEVAGVSDEALALCDYCIEIPQYGSKHSLNIAVSTGIVLWECVRGRMA